MAAARSGMLPGFVSGFYSFDDCHVDLARLAQYAGATLILAPATGLDLQVSCLPPFVHASSFSDCAGGLRVSLPTYYIT
jgi:hypothetical protein